MPDYEKLNIEANLHREVKIAAAVNGETMRAFAERALRHALDGNGKRLTDSRPSYETRTEV